MFGQGVGGRGAKEIRAGHCCIQGYGGGRQMESRLVFVFTFVVRSLLAQDEVTATGSADAIVPALVSAAPPEPKLAPHADQVRLVARDGGWLLLHTGTSECAPLPAGDFDLFLNAEGFAFLRDGAGAKMWAEHHFKLALYVATPSTFRTSSIVYDFAA